MTGPVQVLAEVLSTKRVGPFHHLTLVAPGVAEQFRPGTLIAVAVGGPLSERLDRRTLPIHRARPTSAYGGTVELVLDPAEPGEQWLAAAPVGTRLDVIGPLGRPFALPKEPVACLLVGHDLAAAPLQALADRLRERGCSVHLLLGGESEPRVFGALEARRSASSVTVATDDGSLGIKGTLTSQLPAAMTRVGPAVVYAAGPHALLHAVAVAAEEHGSWSQTLLSVPMPCGTGLCGGCPVPVVGPEGAPHQARACTEGPVFRGDRVVWETGAAAVEERSA